MSLQDLGMRIGESRSDTQLVTQPIEAGRVAGKKDITP